MPHNHETSRQTESSLKQTGRIAGRAGRRLLRGKSLGFKLKLFAVVIIVLVLFAIISMIVNTANVSSSKLTLTDKDETDSIDVDEYSYYGKEEIITEDIKYTEIIVQYMLEEYEYLETAIKEECEKNGVDYELSKDNIIDNTVIPQMASVSSSQIASEYAGDWDGKSKDGKVYLGEAGDSSSKAQKNSGDQSSEVRVRKAGGSWDYVFRWKDPSKALLASKIMYYACQNQHIGYRNRSYETSTSFFVKLIEANGDPTKITEDCDTACSQMVAAVCVCLGADFPKNSSSDRRKTWVNATALANVLKKSKDFEVFTDNSYTKATSKLQPGDIIVRANRSSWNHAAMIVQTKDGLDATIASGTEEGSFSAKSEYSVLGNISKTTGRTYSLSTPSDKPVAQSFAYADGNYWVSFIDAAASGITGIVRGFSDDGDIIKGSDKSSSIYHANGSAGGPNNEVLIAGFLKEGKKNTAQKFVADGDNIKAKGSVTLPSDASSIAYDRDTGKYILCVGKSMYIYDKTLSKKESTVSRNMHGIYYQDIGAGGGYIFACHTKDPKGSGNYIDIYKESTGDYCGTYTVNYWELESAEVVNNELVILVHEKGSSQNVIQYTGITVEVNSSGTVSLDTTALAATREVATVISAFSVYEAQNLPVLDIQESTNTFDFILNTAKSLIKRDSDPEKTLKSILKNTKVIKGDKLSGITLFHITYSEPQEKNGKKYYPLIEINPVDGETIAKLFHMDPDAEYTTEAPAETEEGRGKGTPYAIGDTTVAEAIDTSTDEHLELLYDNLNGESPYDDMLVVPIKKLFTTLKLSKTFAKDKKGIECKPENGTDVYCCERSRVEEIIENDDGTFTVRLSGKYDISYYNLTGVTLKRGEMVSANTVIGKTKGVFRLEVKSDGEYVDPEALFIKTKYSGKVGLETQPGIINGRRTSAPENGNKYYKSPANTYPRNWSGAGGNCTWYAWGRFMEAQGHTNIPAFKGDAFNWINTNAYQTGKNPQPGALIIWDYGTGANGHVAFVEEVKSNGDIVCTESGWGSTDGIGYLFKEVTYKKSNNYSMGIGTCKGFIYPKYSVTSGTTSSVSFDSGSKGIYQKYAYSLFSEYGWTDSDMTALIELWNHESSWNPKAENSSSGAYGIPQALPGSKMSSEGSDWKTNYKTQIKWGLKYIKSRYGSPSKAWKFWKKNNWY